MKILGAGLITADLIIECDSRWHPTRSPAYTSGGTVTNILSHLSYWGWDCGLLGGVGSDPLGAVVLDELRTFGVAVDGVVIRDGADTRRFGHLVALEGPKRGQHRFVERCPLCTREFPAFTPIALAEIAEGVASFDDKVVLLIDRANPLTLELAQATKRAGGLVVFEPGYLSRNRETVVDLLGLVDVLKFSEELLWEGNPFRESPHAHPQNASLVIETRSSTGVVARRPGVEIRLTTTPILEVIDSAGAGDAFMAGLLTGLGSDRLLKLREVEDRDLEAALERGQALGALACCFVGANSILQLTQRDELAKQLEFTMRERRIPLDYGGEGFTNRSLRRTAALQSEAARNGLCATCLLPETEK